VKRERGSSGPQLRSDIAWQQPNGGRGRRARHGALNLNNFDNGGIFKKLPLRLSQQYLHIFPGSNPYF